MATRMPGIVDVNTKDEQYNSPLYNTTLKITINFVHHNSLVDR